MDEKHPSHADPRPKRRKDKDNPYEIFTTGAGTSLVRYYIRFKDGSGSEHCLEIEKDLFDLLDRFELDDLRHLNEVDKHYEHSELTEATLNERAFLDEYIDDGWSGTNFDRPSFQRMIDDIEDGKINCVVTKDLSRLGRNYILTGQYTEIYFPSKGVRYIAVNDNVDTIKGENELAPFLNILNEMHARQTGKEDELLKRLLNASDKERSSARKRQENELKKAEKRKAEVDALFAKMYEDWSVERITEYNFNMLSQKYQTEQRELDAKIEQLREAAEAAAQTAIDAEKWISLLKQYVTPTELTAEYLNALIEKILVHEAIKGEDGKREQEVEIFYRFIGKIE